MANCLKEELLLDTWDTDWRVIVCDGGTGGYGSVEAMEKMVKDLEAWERETGETSLVVDPAQKTVTHGETTANRL